MWSQLLLHLFSTAVVVGLAGNVKAVSGFVLFLPHSFVSPTTSHLHQHQNHQNQRSTTLSPLSFLSRCDRHYSSCTRLLAAKSTPPPDHVAHKKKPIVVAVIGGGWAGFSAADSLSQLSQNYTDNSNDVKVVLLDASSRGLGGLAGGGGEAGRGGGERREEEGWNTTTVSLPENPTKRSRSMEAGIHGFWREYKNTFAIMKESIGLDLDHVLTPYMPSILVSETGRVAVAPVILDTNSTDDDYYDYDDEHDKEPVNRKSPAMIDFSSKQALLQSVADQLPPPLDLALLATDWEGDKKNPLSSLTVSDRLSALGLLGAWADFGQEDAESWERYDAITAESLFRDIAGVSPRLYQQLISPLLHVLPMAPGYDVSAAAALSCFHVFALQSKGAFDVRWCRGSIIEKIFDPWSAKLKARNVTIQGSSRVTSIIERQEKDNNKKFIITVKDSSNINNETETIIVCDAIVLAVGATAAKNLLKSSPPLAALPITKNWNPSFLRGITCVAVRLLLQPNTAFVEEIRKAMTASPVVVCGPRIGGNGRIPELAETGFCIYDLSRLQDDFARQLEQGECLALEVDYFRADQIANTLKTDAEMADLSLRAVSAALNIPLSSSSYSLLSKQEQSKLVKEVSVVRARNAVSHFCVGSATASPSGTRLRHGMYICGDWIDRKGHASWSTEKAVVTGKQAALALAQDFDVLVEQKSSSSPAPPPIKILPAASDTAQLAALRQVASAVRKVLPVLTRKMIPPAPWVLLRQVFDTTGWIIRDD